MPVAMGPRVRARVRGDDDLLFFAGKMLNLLNRNMLAPQQCLTVDLAGAGFRQFVDEADIAWVFVR